MKVAITSTQSNLEGKVDPRFGRCRYFLIVDTETLQFEAIENPNASLGGGAGIQSGQLVAQKGVEAVLTGNCGPNAFQTLAAAGINVVTGASGLIKEAIEKFKSGQLGAADEANVPSHSGMASKASEKEETMPRGDGTGPTGQGPGTGRGMGMGSGGGQGRGGGFALGPGGNCVCPNCGKTAAHQQGSPCYKMKCPACGAAMTRQR